jgi:hypothetical protein
MYMSGKPKQSPITAVCNTSLLNSWHCHAHVQHRHCLHKQI